MMRWFSGDWPEDPRLDPYREAVFELRHDGRVVAHLVTEVVRMRSLNFWLKQEVLHFQVHWLNGRVDGIDEDYAPGWYTVAQLEQGCFEPSWDDGLMLSATKVGSPRQEELLALYGPPDPRKSTWEGRPPPPF